MYILSEIHEKLVALFAGLSIGQAFGLVGGMVCLLAGFNFFITFPLVFNFWIIPQIQRRIGEKLRFNLLGYYMAPYNYFLGSNMEVAYCIAERYLCSKFPIIEKYGRSFRSGCWRIGISLGWPWRYLRSKIKFLNAICIRQKKWEQNISKYVDLRQGLVLDNVNYMLQFAPRYEIFISFLVPLNILLFILGITVGLLNPLPPLNKSQSTSVVNVNEANHPSSIALTSSATQEYIQTNRNALFKQ